MPAEVLIVFIGLVVVGGVTLLTVMWVKEARGAREWPFHKNNGRKFRPLPEPKLLSLTLEQALSLMNDHIDTVAGIINDEVME